MQTIDQPVSKAEGSGYARLEDQIDWYDRKSITAQRSFRALRVAQIFISAAIPIVSLLNTDSTIAPGALGAAILVLEGLQELGKYRDNWQKYQSACETLRHEKFYFKSLSGPYRDLSEQDAKIILSERVEDIISREHSVWVKRFSDDPRQDD